MAAAISLWSRTKGQPRFHYHYIISESQDRTSKVKAIDRLQQNVMSDTGCSRVF